MRIIYWLPLLLISFISTSAYSQDLPVFAENTYRTSSNPHYWKSRKPFADYWQQDVHYRIKAKLYDSIGMIEGQEQLTYWNNSPDTLFDLYFHLYQNAFQPNSYLHQLKQAGNIETTFGANEAAGRGTQVSNIRINGINAISRLNNTVLHIQLSEPLLPGARLSISMDFKTWFDRGSLRRRMKVFEHNGLKHFDGVHWYPRICVYDRKFGWTTDQHLGKEFYGDFGTWDVELIFPVEYVLEATGELMNREEALPEELRKKLDISNFKTPGSLTEITPADGSYKSWKFHAENVHDFAFTADPSYRIGEVVWNGIRCIALAQEPNAYAWQPTAGYVAKLIQIYSEDFGMYAYPKMVAADARDGMEYPMITLNSGKWPGHQYVISHEVGHNWFFGMVGSNETYRAGMDEGFTQFLTAWSLKEVSGRTQRPNPIEEGVVYLGYIRHAQQENNGQLNVHSDHFNSAERHGGGYGQVYYKAATMLYNLEYVLGDQVFKSAMQHYFNKWKMAHPYWEDFRTAIIEYSKRDLNWFFDAWIESNQLIDYAVLKPQKLKSESDSFCYQLRFKRLEEMHMPLDIEIRLTNENQHSFLIPNHLKHKKVAGQEVLPEWIGWGLIAKEYQTKQCFQAPIASIQLDSSGRLADINLVNNQWRRPFRHDFGLLGSPAYDRFSYAMHYSPDIWYNTVDGIKAGVRIQGNYMMRNHVFDLSMWYNTGAHPGLPFAEEIGVKRQLINYWNTLFNYCFTYKHRIGHLTDVFADSRILEGLQAHQIGIDRKWDNQSIRFYYKALTRQRQADLSYVHNPEFWGQGQWNNSFNIDYTRNYQYTFGNGVIHLDLRNASLFSDYNYSWLKTEVINNNRIGSKLNLKTRFFAGFISDQAAPESQIFLAGASAEEWMGQKWIRSRGWFPDEWAQYTSTPGHMHYGGGLNIRSQSAYRASNVNEKGDSISVFAGRSGIAANVELDFSKYLPSKLRNSKKPFSLESYLFGDAGWLGTNNGHSGLRANAGLGFAANVRMPWVKKARPLKVRCDLPFFVNRTPPGQENFIDFRWVVGINRAF
jgi:hypothetical protein